MATFSQLSMKLKGNLLKSSLDNLTKDPQTAQKKELLKILKRNKSTKYGQTYTFNNINNERDFQKHVPVNQYKDLEPYIENMIDGHSNILTADAPVMFNLTSGTSDKPKYIPVTAKTKKQTDLLMHQWLYRAQLDHPSFLNKYNLIITGTPVEGQTSCGIAYGSLSGQINSQLPQSVMERYILPFIIAKINNYDLRYYAMARLAFEKDISFVATPNPTTLIRLAEIGIEHQEEIIRSIRDGSLIRTSKFQMNDSDLEIVKKLNSSMEQNKPRYNYLNNILKIKDRLLPRYCWPSLELIGCWLGGSVGYYAEKLTSYYGDVPKRDIGYLASEGSFSLPYKDFTPSGILTLQNNFYEFIPEDMEIPYNGQPLLSHELEEGRLYKILLTNESGMYRYDINDTIRVDGYYNHTPVLAFVRKTNDMLNVTGEKLHLNQLLMAFKKLQSKFKISISQFRVAANADLIRHEIYICLDQDVCAEHLKKTILPAIDLILSEINVEYFQKRKSKRLSPPCLHIMQSSWEKNIRKNLIESGMRDIQYKWQPLSCDFLELDRKYIEYSINHKEE